MQNIQRKCVNGIFKKEVITNNLVKFAYFYFLCMKDIKAL